MVGGKAKIEETYVIKFAIDSPPRSHTCSFEFEPPLYSSKENFRKYLLKAMDMAQGIEDWLSTNLKSASINQQSQIKFENKS